MCSVGETVCEQLYKHPLPCTALHGESCRTPKSVYVSGLYCIRDVMLVCDYCLLQLYIFTKKKKEKKSSGSSSTGSLSALILMTHVNLVIYLKKSLHMFVSAFQMWRFATCLCFMSLWDECLGGRKQASAVRHFIRILYIFICTRTSIFTISGGGEDPLLKVTVCNCSTIK